MRPIILGLEGNSQSLVRNLYREAAFVATRDGEVTGNFLGVRQDNPNLLSRAEPTANLLTISPQPQPPSVVQHTTISLDTQG